MGELSLFSKQVKKAFKLFGLDLIRYRPTSHPEAKKAAQIQDRAINVVLDVGANTGQYAEHLREIGYQGKILSFEPLKEAFKTLEKKASTDPVWKVYNFALGSEESKLDIHVAESSASSSLFDATENLISLHPTSRVVEKDTVQVKCLDSLFEELCPDGSNVFLKIDTQGYEKEVLFGAQGSLNRIEMIQVEMSFVPLYEGQTLFEELYRWLCEHGYRLSCFEGAWWDPKTGDMMQVDGVFQREK